MFKYVFSVVLAVAGLGSGSVVHASTTVISNAQNSTCISLDGSKDPGHTARATTCDGSDGQQWNTQVVAFGYGGTAIVRFVNAYSGLCLDNAPGPNAGVVQSICNGSATQQWQIDAPQIRSSTGNPVAVSRQIRSQSGYCLDGNLYAGQFNVNAATCAPNDSSATQDWYVDVF